MSDRGVGEEGRCVAVVRHGAPVGDETEAATLNSSVEAAPWCSEAGYATCSRWHIYDIALLTPQSLFLPIN